MYDFPAYFYLLKSYSSNIDTCSKRNLSRLPGSGEVICQLGSTSFAF